MTKRDFEMTTEQMQAILAGAPDGAEYCWFDFSDSNDVWYYKDYGNQYWFKNGWGFCNDPQFPKKLDERLIKLSDIRVELSSRLSKTIDKSVCLSNIAENDTQSDLSVESDSQEQSVIERFTNLAESFREIGKQFQSPRSIERGIWIAAAMYIERELKEVAGDE